MVFMSTHQLVVVLLMTSHLVSLYLSQVQILIYIFKAGMKEIQHIKLKSNNGTIMLLVG